jgi:hypothetical protein
MCGGGVFTLLAIMFIGLLLINLSFDGTNPRLRQSSQ